MSLVNISQLIISIGILFSSIWGAKIGLPLFLFALLSCFKRKTPSKEIFVEKFKSIKYWIYINIGIILFALLSLFFCFDVIQTAKSIFLFLAVPFIISCISFLAFSSSMERKNNIFLIFSIFSLHSFLTIWQYFSIEKSRSVGLGEHSIIPYALILLFPLAMSLSLFVYTRFKALSIVLIFTSLFALYCNGTRASILSATLMIFGAFLYPQYRYKRILFSIFLVLIMGYSFALYKWSEKQPSRYNYAQMLQNISKAWDYAPAEMGRFDVQCFDGSINYFCREESGGKLDQSAIFDSSALYRLSLNKSALSIIQDNPLIPHGYYPLFFDLNIPKITEKRNYPYRRNFSEVRTYSHIQNGFLSSFYELGIFGGMLYCFSFILLIFYSLKKRNLISMVLFTWILGIIPQNLLDVPLAYGGISLVFYATVGCLLGYIQGGDNENNF